MDFLVLALYVALGLGCYVIRSITVKIFIWLTERNYNTQMVEQLDFFSLLLAGCWYLIYWSLSRDEVDENYYTYINY